MEIGRLGFETKRLGDWEIRRLDRYGALAVKPLNRGGSLSSRETIIILVI
jgi:hypothetical protein